jgi:hypothetical protein
VLSRGFRSQQSNRRTNWLCVRFAVLPAAEASGRCTTKARSRQTCRNRRSKEETASTFSVDEVDKKILHYVQITVSEQGLWKATFHFYHPEDVLLEFRR